MRYIGYLGGTRVDYQGYPSKGGFLPDDFNLALSAMRKAKSKMSRHFNSKWRDDDYILVKGNNDERIIKMKDVWQGRL